MSDVSKATTVTDLLAYKAQRDAKARQAEAEQAFIDTTGFAPQDFLQSVLPTYKLHVEPTAVSLDYVLCGDFGGSDMKYLGRLRLEKPRLGARGGGVRIQERSYLIRDCPDELHWRLCEHLEDAFERIGTELMLTGFQQLEQLPFRVARIDDELRLVGLSRNEKPDTMYFVGRGLLTPYEYKGICDSFSDS